MPTVEEIRQRKRQDLIETCKQRLNGYVDGHNQIEKIKEQIRKLEEND